MKQKTDYDIIEKQKLLLVEGKDEVEFFKVFLNKKDIQDVKILESGGKEQFARQIKAIKNTPGFDHVHSLAVIHDADDNPHNRFKSICSILKNNDFKAPEKIGSFTSGTDHLKIGIFIIPDNKNQGMLESLCLSIAKSEGMITCVDSFIECTTKYTSQKGSAYKQPKNLPKARLRAFLATMEKDTPTLGLAAQKGYWDWDSKKLQPLLDFLHRL